MIQFLTEENSIFLTYCVLIVLALIPIIVGSYAAVHATEVEEQLSSSDAAWYPIYGSGKKDTFDC